MKIIKINKTTIRKNPNAGNTVTYINRGSSASFKIEGNVPKFINKPPFFVEEWRIDNNKMVYASGKINGVIDQTFIDKAPNLQITMYNDIETIYHQPEPDYLYEYKETYLRCSHCKNKVDVDEIQTDWVDDEYEITVCPVCEAENSFREYRFQQFSELKWEF